MVTAIPPLTLPAPSCDDTQGTTYRSASAAVRSSHVSLPAAARCLSSSAMLPTVRKGKLKNLFTAKLLLDATSSQILLVKSGDIDGLVQKSCLICGKPSVKKFITPSPYEITIKSKMGEVQHREVFTLEFCSQECSSQNPWEKQSEKDECKKTKLVPIKE